MTKYGQILEIIPGKLFSQHSSISLDELREALSTVNTISLFMVIVCTTDGL